MDEVYDLVVVGGGKTFEHYPFMLILLLARHNANYCNYKIGVYGLAVPKTFLEVNPSARVLMLDAGQSIGGTWSAERLYDGLRTNNLIGSLEYSDFPMHCDKYGVPPGTHIDGTVMHKYLNDYVDHFGFRDRIRLGATVKSAELMKEGSWLIQYDWQTSEKDANDMTLVAKKLVLATGTTSEPFIPQIPGSDTFGGPLFHSKEFADRTADMCAAKNIVVLGGSKSSADCVYLNAQAGRHVDWVIRGTPEGGLLPSSPGKMI